MDLSNYTLEILHQDSEFALYRGLVTEGGSSQYSSILISMPISKTARPDHIHMLQQELVLRTELDPEWAATPIALVEYGGRTALILEDPQGEPLTRIIRASSDGSAVSAWQSKEPVAELGLFLRLAIGVSVAIGEMHQRGIIHKNIKPPHILVDVAAAQAWLTGFGIASRLARERQNLASPETIAGTLAYMAPEQTGRMNRSIDARSDLYALGITFYELLTGTLPFNASDPMEWVHCHIARQAVPPNERVKGVPLPVSAIIMKLLEKTAEARYQTAAGLEYDLRRCLARFEIDGRIDNFALGERDTSDRLLLPEKLYGREHEVAALSAAFGRTLDGETPELVLVSGYAGIGKSAVVNELHKAFVSGRGLFASGKFDQYKRDIPYSTLAQAFQRLIRSLLSKNDTELGRWREALLAALGPNGQLMVDLVPELKLIVGEQMPVAELPLQEAKRRFQHVFHRFIAVFAQSDHPLTLFLDDLQWLDVATLELIEDLVTRRDVRHLLLIGAYRDNDLTSAHPLLRTLGRVRGARVPVHDIVLAPLNREQVGEFIADSIGRDRQEVVSLAELVHEKTAGNPFFVAQFLSTLAVEGLLTFDRKLARWIWDAPMIHAKGYTDNVVDLMVRKLSRLPIRTQKFLQWLACLGNSAELARVTAVHEGSEEELRDKLQDAVQTELIVLSDGIYHFLHDRVQEAAYSLIPVPQRKGLHLQIGRLLLTRTTAEKREEVIFEIVNQLNLGVSLITLSSEKKQLAELNLFAGKRAIAAAAYMSAMHYLVAGTELLQHDGWGHSPDLMFALQFHRAECEFLTGELEAAEMRLTMLSSQVADLVDKATVASLRIDLYTSRSNVDRAIDVCLNYLGHLGFECLPHPAEEEIQREYAQIWSLVGLREIKDLVGLPIMSDPEAIATLTVLTKALGPATHVDLNLYSLLVCRAVLFSVEHGNSDASCIAYANMSTIAGLRFDNYEAASQFGQLSRELVEQRGLRGCEARTYYWLGNSSPWTKHLRSSYELFRRAINTASANGDLMCAAHANIDLNAYLFAAGDSLSNRQREFQCCLETAQKAHFGLDIDLITPSILLIRMLRGLAENFGCFNDASFDELEFERHLSSDARFAGIACTYWIRKMQGRFFAGDFEAAADASLHAQQLLWSGQFVFKAAEAHFYGALSHAACCNPRHPFQYLEHKEALKAHYQQIAKWAKNCPENFENRALLVGAEIARIEGRELDAERQYEAAVKSASEGEFVHNEAVGNELAARFYAARGYETISHAYLRNARDCYLRWGANGKVKQLDQLYPHLMTEQSASVSTNTIGALVEQLDLATVLEVLQTVSGEVVLEKLIDTVMRAAIEYAGAERALLMLSRESGHRVVAEARTSEEAVSVQLFDDAISGSMLPETVFYYVLRTQESVILDDAEITNLFTADAYFDQHVVRSMLCLPLTNRAKMIGVLYLENNLAPRVFVSARIAVLKILASQAAISLENARLYQDLSEREGRIRRLVDSNIIGIFIWELSGTILEANDAFLTMVGYEQKDLIARHLRWTDLTPPEWHVRDQQMIAELKIKGTLQPFEKEYFRKDGSRVPVLLGTATFEGTGNQGVAYVLDLTERKRAQEALNRVSAELAHVSRVSALSALTASITHEINQPLSGIITNAGTCLRLLDAAPPNIDGARETARRTIRDGNRASEVISRLRSLFSKRGGARETLDLNETAGEVVALLSNDLRRNRIVLQMEFADDLPVVTGDRVQLQQVILNLVRNASDAMADVEDQARQLLIKTERDADCAVLSVRDAGIGLPPEGAISLFDAFHTTKSGGMGIGLFVSRSIIERHNGRLWAKQNQPGPGATFSFSIPHTAERTL